MPEARIRLRRRAGPRRYLIVMVKEPRAGAVKTRLGRDIGLARATQFYRSVLRAVVARLHRPREWTLILAVSPDRALHSRALPAIGRRAAQGRGDLGQRMARAMTAQPGGPVAVIGSDIPAIRATHIRSAFRALGACEAVLGPAPDGGYWLAGFNLPRHAARAFRAVRWSGPNALGDTLANLDGLRVGMLEPLRDADSVADLEHFRGRHGCLVLH